MLYNIYEGYMNGGINVKKDFKYKLDNQLFGDDPADTAQPADPVAPAAPAVKTLQELLASDPALQKEYEEQLRVQQLQIEAAHKAELSQQQRLAQLNDDERRAEELRIREEELTRRARDIEVRELRSQASLMLVERKLPETLLDMVDFTSADTVKASIDVLKATFDKSLSAEVQKIAQSTPTPPGGSTSGGTKTKTEHDKKIESLKKRWRLD